MAPPFKTVKASIIYGKGLDHITEVTDIAIAFGLIKKSGAWFSYGEERIGQGKLNAVAYVRENPEVAEILEKTIKEKLAAGEIPDFKKA